MMEILKHEAKKHAFHMEHKAVFRADETELALTDEEIVGKVAARTNYHPFGYGMNFPRIRELKDGKHFVATWESAKTCS